MFVPWAVVRNQWAKVEYGFMHVMFGLCQILDLILPDQPAHPLHALEVIKSSKSVKDWLNQSAVWASQEVLYISSSKPIAQY